MLSSGSSQIQVQQLVKGFGKVQAVDDVSFNVGKGEIVGLLGPSGCGKTTILRCISGLEDIDAGEILLDGKVVTSPKNKIFVPPEKRRLGFVFQSYALWPHMTVRQNISYCLKGFSSDEKERRIRSSLELVGLTDVGNRYPSQLSGGQQQRVALARSLSYEPSVVLLDEPLSNLDLKERERVRGELRALLKKIGITSVFVTHDQEEAFVISDRVVLLNHGQIMQQGSPEELYSKPADLFVAQFIGRANVLKANVREISDGNHRATLNLPELGANLVCEHEGEISMDTNLVAVRFNEISISSKPMEERENIVEGNLVSREYRGSVTDHRIRVHDTELAVTTHKFCSASEHSPPGGRIYVRIPPTAIKPLRT